MGRVSTKLDKIKSGGRFGGCFFFYQASLKIGRVSTKLDKIKPGEMFGMCVFLEVWWGRDASRTFFGGKTGV